MVLVTGASGFIGSYIVKQLVEQGYDVKAIYRKHKLPFHIRDEISKKIQWIKADVLDKNALSLAMESVDMIIHAAGIVSFVPADRDKMYEVNIDGTANMVAGAIKNNVKKFVHISSISAIGISNSGDTFNEDAEWKDSSLHSHYAITKMKAEQAVRNGIEKGLKAVIVNPTTVIGYGNWHQSSCELFRNVYRGFKWYSNGVNGLVDVEDVARATLQLMESGITDERFILNSENWTFKKLMDAIADGFNIPHPNRKATSGMLAVAWRFEMLRSFITRKKPVITKEIAEAAESKSYFDNRKLLSALPGFSFTPIKQSVEVACRNYLLKRQPY